MKDKALELIEDIASEIAFTEDINLLKEHIKNIQWEYPEDVQLLICDQEDDRFKIWNLID